MRAVALIFAIFLSILKLTNSNRNLKESKGLVFNLKLTNNSNHYSVPLSISSKNQKFDLMISLSSVFTSIPSLQCGKCCRETTNKFNESDSNTLKKTNESKIINYPNKGEFKGVISSDSLNTQAGTLNNFKFLLFNEENHLNNIKSDGVLGLGFTEQIENEYSFIFQSFNQEMVKFAKFYLSISKNKQSQLFIGEQFKEIFDPNKMSYCSVNKLANTESELWRCQVHELKFDDNHFKLDTNIIFEASLPEIIIPEKHFNLIKKNYFGEHECDTDLSGKLICKCQSPENFKDIEFTLPKNTSFTIKSKNFIYFNSTSEYQCRFEIIIDEYSEDWVIGYSGFYDVLLSFDLLSKKIGFSTQEFKGKDVVVVNQEENSVIVYLLWVAILGVVIYFAIKHLIDQKNQKRIRETEEMQQLENRN